MTSLIDSRVAALATRPEDEIDLAEAALTLACDHYPELRVEHYLGEIDALASAAAEQIGGVPSAANRIVHLNHFLFLDCGFRGNADGYHDPRNSYLNEVLERRLGIPITLGILYVEIARRLDLNAAGVGFPGHFLVRHVGSPDVIVDPFFGTVLTWADCEERLRQQFGATVQLQASMLEPSPKREILARLLRNLKQISLGRGDFEAALHLAGRILQFMPESAGDLRDRGLIYRKLECHGAAVADLDRYLELAPQDAQATAIRASMPALRSLAAQIH